MSLTLRLRRLEQAIPRCDPRVRWLAPEGHVSSDADRCRRCGGCHLLVIKEEIVEVAIEPEEVRT